MARQEKQAKKATTGKGAGLRSIRVKLIMIILALSIIPLVVMTFFTARSIHDTVMDLEDQLAEQRTATARGEVLSLIDQTFNGVDVLAKDPTLKQALMDPSEENLKTARKTLIDVQEAFPAGETTTFVFNDKGMQIVRADDAELGDISDREYAQKAIEGTKYLSDVVISKVTGQGTIFMAAPIKDDKGKVLGGLAKVANLEDLSEAMGEITNAHTNITVMDRVGSMAASTEEFDFASGELIDLSQEDYFQKAQSGSGMEIIEHNGKKVLATYTQEPNTSWTVVCFTDYTTVIAPYKRILRVSMIILVIAVLAVVIIGYLFSSSLANPIVRVMEFARILAAGDFTTDPLVVNRKDELGEMSASLNDMYANNADVIRNIGEGSSKVSHSSSELSETSQDLLARFEEVASSMERVNDAMTSTGAATEEVSASANEVNESVERLAEETANTKREVIAIEKKAAEIEREGRESSEHAINIAEERGRELEEAAEAAKVVSEIGTMADSIADIANQINLLSLNASIEAARAGEHGRGFAVVAGEINNLASETKSAVEQIQATVDKIQSAFDLLRRSSMELLSFMRETVAPDYEKFITIGQEYGSDARTFGQLADNISEMVHYISESMDQVNAAVAEIAESATSTSSSSAEVTDTIGEAANMMERMSGMANDSQEVSARLDSIVKQFKLNE